MTDQSTTEAPQDAAVTTEAAAPPADTKTLLGDASATIETKPADAPKDGDGKPGEEKPKDEPEGAPEAYDLKMPEGIEVDTKLLDAFSPKFKELGLTNAKAQEFADLYVEARKAETEQQHTQWTSTQQDWVQQGKTDKETGGPVYETAVRSARSALDRFGTPELREALNVSGMGNHPEMLRLMARVGLAISEDSPPAGGVSAAKPDLASILYPENS